MHSADNVSLSSSVLTVQTKVYIVNLYKGKILFCQTTNIFSCTLQTCTNKVFIERKYFKNSCCTCPFGGKCFLIGFFSYNSDVWLKDPDMVIRMYGRFEDLTFEHFAPTYNTDKHMISFLFYSVKKNIYSHNILLDMISFLDACNCFY